MADPFRVQVAALSRTLEEFRRNDPEHRVFAERLGTAAAVKHAEQVHEDVARPEGAPELRFEHPQEEAARRRRKGHHPAEPDAREEAQEAPPEQAEGHLLDIRA